MSSTYPTRKELGSVIRSIRESRGLTRETLAGAAGIHTTYLARVELARSNPSWEKVAAVAKGLGMAVSELALEVEKETVRRANGRKRRRR